MRSATALESDAQITIAKGCDTPGGLLFCLVISGSARVGLFRFSAAGWACDSQDKSYTLSAAESRNIQKEIQHGLLLRGLDGG